MELPRTPFVVTPWRSRQELLRLRQDLYGSDATKKERAMNKVFAWRLRKPEGLPLLLDSTADIVDVILQDEKNELNHNASRLLYATALSRFVTGLADTQIDLTRDKPSWFPPGKTIQLPLPLLEIRHRIVHRHLPSLAELKRAAQDSLDWLWNWYWSQLDHAFGTAKSGEELEEHGSEAVREKLQSMLKTYVKERKSEIKTRKKDSKAAEHALSTYTLRYAPSSTSAPSDQTRKLLFRVLIDEKMILPTDKKLGSSLSGAFLIWDPLLLILCQSTMSASTLATQMTNAMNTLFTSRAMISTDMDPVKEGMYDWALHILCSDEWQPTRAHEASTLIENTLVQCFSEPTHWNIRLAEALLKNAKVPNQKQWLAVLAAAKNETDESANEPNGEDTHMDIGDLEQGLPVSQAGVQEKVIKEKIRGPLKAIGMWKPRPIGWLPPGWEDDE